MPIEHIPDAVSDMIDDYTLIVRLNAGSQKAFASLYDKYVSMVFGYVHSILKDRVLAEDITQFCFMRLWENRTKISANRNLPAWLYVTARNAVYKEVRHKATVAKYMEYASISKSSNFNSRSSDYDLKLLDAEVRRVIASLPETRRRIYLMKTEDGMSTAEIAALLGISPKTVDNQIARAKQHLRKSISKFMA